MVKRRGDFFRLTVEDLETLERFARKSAENLYAAIAAARVGGRWRASSTRSGIPQVGEQTAIDLAALAGRARAPDDAGRRRLARPRFARSTELRRGDRGAGARSTEVPGIGPTVAASLGALVHRRGDARRPRELVEAGVEPGAAGVRAAGAAAAGPLDGKTWS